MRAKSLTSMMCLLALSTVHAAAHAATAEMITEVATRHLQQLTETLPGKVSITVKPVDGRQQTLERCTQLQAFLPQGQKAWGRVTVGVRCLQGVNASLYLSGAVKVEGSFLKLARSVPGGQTLEQADLMTEQGELTAYPADLVVSLNEAVGQVTRQALSPGQPLRSGYLQHEISIQAGQPVRVVAHGGGFSVVNRGRALGNATRGSVARVKLDNGQIISGIASEAGVVDVSDRR